MVLKPQSSRGFSLLGICMRSHAPHLEVSVLLAPALICFLKMAFVSSFLRDHCAPAPVSAPGMKRVRHFARPQQQQRQQLGSGSGTDGQTSARGRAGGRPLAPSCAARWRCLLLSLSLGNSQLTLCSLVPSLPTYACSLDFPGMRDHVHIHRRGPKDFGGKKMGAKENDDCCT